MIDTSFDFYSDTPHNKDPDSHSPTLLEYHKRLWTKPLPDGQVFRLCDTTPKVYLHHKSQIGEFFLGSDAITNSYRDTRKLSQTIEQVRADADELFSIGSTIGAYIIFPSNKIDNKMTINGARGLNRNIWDRFDLTLECIRLYYQNQESPLKDVFHRYDDYFALFFDFKGYVEFFLLQDIVSTDFKTVNFHLPFSGFGQYPLPKSIDEYLSYKENITKFVNARNKRILKFSIENSI